MKVESRALVFALLTLLSAAPAAPAQGPESEMVPLELVQTLSVGPAGRGRAPPEVLVGRLPDATARVLPVPPDSRIVGALVSRGRSMSAVAVPGTPAAVRDDWTARLLAAGWTQYEPPSRGGFVAHPLQNLPFCLGDSATVRLEVSENPRGGSYVRIVHETSRRTSICHAEERPPSRAESLIPSLSPPPGSVTRGGGAGGGSDEWYARARIETHLSVEQLIDHYGAQLRSEGWTPLERTASRRIAVETFRVTDEDGVAWHGTLIASAHAADSDRFMDLRVTRLERGRRGP